MFARLPSKIDLSYGLSICAHICLFAFLYSLTPLGESPPQIIVYLDSSPSGGGGLESEAIAELEDPAGAMGATPVRMRRSMSTSLADFVPMRAHELPVQPDLQDITLTLRRPLFEQNPEFAERQKRILARLERKEIATVDALEVARGFRSGDSDLLLENANRGETDGEQGAGDSAAERDASTQGLAATSGKGPGSGGGIGTGSGGGNGAWHGKFPGIDEGNSPPVYPRDALAAGREGMVRLHVRVAVDGSVAALRIATSSGDPSLDDAALAAVRDWHFKPAERGGVPVAADVVVPVRFVIRSNALSKQLSIQAS